MVIENRIFLWYATMYFFQLNNYVVSIAVIPNCSWSYYMESKTKQICKYIIVLSLGVDPNDSLLFQVGYAES